MVETAVVTDEVTPDYFPMGLQEYAVTTHLDPVLEAALRRWVGDEERLKTDWDAILAEYRVLPIK